MFGRLQGGSSVLPRAVFSMYSVAVELGAVVLTFHGKK